MKDDEIRNKLNEVDLLRKFSVFATSWCRKEGNLPEFSLNLKGTREGCFSNIAFPTNKIENEKVLDLIEGIIKNDELSFLNRMHQHLNELSVGMTEEESRVIESVQCKIEEKFLKLGHELYPESFSDKIK